MVYQASQNVSPEKNLKVQKEEESAKPKQVETKKVWYQGAGEVPAAGCSVCLGHLFLLLMFPL